MRRQIDGQEVGEPAAVKMQWPRDVGHQRHRGLERRHRQLRQRLLGALVLRTRLMQ